MNRQKKRDDFEALLRRFDRLFVNDVYKAIRTQIKTFISDLKEGGRDYAERRLDVVLMNPAIAPVVRRIHKKAGLYMAKKTLSELRTIPVRRAKAAGNMGFNSEWTADIQEFFNRYLLNKVVVPISEKTKEIILRVMKEATEKGWSNDQIVDRLLSRELSAYRARRIVRTETVRAVNYGSMLGADKYDYEVVKEWLAVNDNRTRLTHRHGTGVDGQVREINEPFGNGLFFPGDPAGPPEETINCRCAVVLKPKLDERGRMIPKQPGTTFLMGRLAA